MERLDMYSRMPSGLQEYIESNGPHFNRKLCEWAVSKMIVKDDSGKEKKLEAWTQDEVEELNDHIMSFRLRENDCVTSFSIDSGYNHIHSNCNESHELIAVGPDGSHIFLVIKTKDGENIFCHLIVYQYGNFINVVFD